MTTIEEFFPTYKTAVWKKDAAAFLKLYSEELVAFDMWDKGFHGSLQEWSPEMRSWLDSLGEEKVQVDFDMIKTYQSGTVGFASGYISFQAIGMDGKVLRGMKNRISVGFSKENGEWLAVHQHISASVSSKDLTAILDL